MMRSALCLSNLALIVVCAGCGGSNGPTAPTGGVFQIASVVANPVVSECATGPHSAYVTSYLLHLVNTTRNDVTVTGVSSTGLVIRSTRPEEVGMAWNTFASLPFTPSLVASNDFLDMSVTLSSSCLPHPPLFPPAPDEFRDVYTSLRVMTTMGLYATPQITTTIHYKSTFGGGGLRATPRPTLAGKAPSIARSP